MTAPDAAPHSRVEGKSAGAPGATPVAAPADDQLMGDLDREGLMAAAWLLPALPAALFAAAFLGMWLRDLLRT